MAGSRLTDFAVSLKNYKTTIVEIQEMTMIVINNCELKLQ